MAWMPAGSTWERTCAALPACRCCMRRARLGAIPGGGCAGWCGGGGVRHGLAAGQWRHW
jgi:hypothetical protein